MLFLSSLYSISKPIPIKPFFDESGRASGISGIWCGAFAGDHGARSDGAVLGYFCSLEDRHVSCEPFRRESLFGVLEKYPWIPLAKNISEFS